MEFQADTPTKPKLKPGLVFSAAHFPIVIVHAGVVTRSILTESANRVIESWIPSSSRSNLTTAYAAERANREGLNNIEFRQGDIFRLPFADATFDVVWSKYVLQWVKDPRLAIAEFRRVTKSGGVVVCANFDGFAVTHWPQDPTLQPQFEKVVPQLVDPFIGRKMAPMFLGAGLLDVKVDFEPDRLFTVIGMIDPDRRQNFADQLSAARSYIMKILGGEHEADEFAAGFLRYYDDPDTCSYTTLYFVRDTVFSWRTDNA